MSKNSVVDASVAQTAVLRRKRTSAHFLINPRYGGFVLTLRDITLFFSNIFSAAYKKDVAYSAQKQNQHINNY